jgi:hypothetical protein
MIETKRTEKKDWKFEDNSDQLTPELLQAVQAAMKAGLMEFTTPTPEDNEERIDWKVRKWVFMRAGKPCCALVAQKVAFEHFEVAGPEIELALAKA